MIKTIIFCTIITVFAFSCTEENRDREHNRETEWKARSSDTTPGKYDTHDERVLPNSKNNEDTSQKKTDTEK
jgi:hypothetical protein